MTASWTDPAPCDPIANIRDALDTEAKRSSLRALFEGRDHARYAALLALAARRQDSGEAKAAIDAAEPTNGNVWLADERGPLTAGGAPVIVPRLLAIGLGATFGRIDGWATDIATVRTGAVL